VRVEGPCKIVAGFIFLPALG